MFTYTNSIFNPVIYWIFSKDFQKGFNRIFVTLWKRKRSGSSDDELDQDEKRFYKLSTLSDSVSFVWRKFSRSRSETNSPSDLRENQAFLKPRNGGSEDNPPIRVSKISFDFNDTGANGVKDSLGNGKKKSLTTQFNDSNSFLMLPSQSRLAKLSEESLCDVVEQQPVKIRRFGTVEPPREQTISEYHVIKKTTTNDLLLSPTEVADETTKPSGSAEMDNCQKQPTCNGSHLQINLEPHCIKSNKDCNNASENQTLTQQDLTPVSFKNSCSLLRETEFRETTC